MYFKIESKTKIALLKRKGFAHHKHLRYILKLRLSLRMVDRTVKLILPFSVTFVLYILAFETLEGSLTKI